MPREVNRHQISLYPMHSDWVERQREENQDWTFSGWVQSKIEEEKTDAPAFINAD